MTDLYIFIFIFLHCCLIPLLSQYCTIGKSKIHTYIHTSYEFEYLYQCITTFWDRGTPKDPY